MANRFLVAQNLLASDIVVYENMTDDSLRKIARENGVLGFESMSRSVLIHSLKGFTP